MEKILLITGGKPFGHSKGELNHYLGRIAESYLKEHNLQVKKTIIDDGYTLSEEIDKILWADALIYQMPVWWMGLPWNVKKYIDEVFTAGHGHLYQSDGRTRSDETKKYGSGGLLHTKKYMLSVTWNAPEEAFDDPCQLFEGVGVDGVFLPMHKAQQFLGMMPLPTFMCNDVIKAPNIEDDVARYKKHLGKAFASVTTVECAV